MGLMARARKEVRLRGKQNRPISDRVRSRPNAQSASGMALSSRTERRAMKRLAAASARTPAPSAAAPTLAPSIRPARPKAAPTAAIVESRMMVPAVTARGRPRRIRMP